MRVWVLCAKDLRIYTRDKVGLLLGLGLPIVLALVFGAAMGALGGGEGMGRAKLYVQDEDGTEESQRLVEELRTADGLRIVLLTPTREGGESVRGKVADGDGPAGLLIPAGYALAIEDGELPKLELYRDPGMAIEQQIIAGNLLPVLLGASGEAIGERLVESSLDWVDFPEAGRERAQLLLEESLDQMDELVERLELDGLFAEEETPSASTSSPDEEASAESEEEGFDFVSAIVDLLGLQVEDVAGPDRGDLQRIGQQTQAIAGIAVMMLLFGLVACGGTLLEEEAQGTLDRLRLAPAATSTVLKAKFLFTWIIGITQLLILFAVTSQIFDVPIFRDPFVLFVHSSAVAFAATGFGVLFAVLCRSRSQLEGLSTIVILTMSAFGGSWWPLMMTPDWYQSLAHLTLTAWAMDGYQGIFWNQHGLSDLLPELGVLLGIGVATSLASLALWRRRLRVV